MQFASTPLAIPEVLLIRRRRFEDSRGYFMVTYEAGEFRRLGLPDFVQDNQAQSVRRGTLRGLHFQRPPYAQAKLVWALRGAIFDVALDIRADSATFGEWVGATLEASTGDALFVPRGFAHGYCTLADNTEVAYKCDAEYAPSAEGGVLFSDPRIGVTWPISQEALVVSERDRRLPLFRDLITPFTSDVGA